jgi:uncharacterized protein (DUF697 family)/predicted GTPase
MASLILPTAAEIDASAGLQVVTDRGSSRIAPVVWMIGKVQSGKTSIIRAITGSSAAEIGIGFEACTATSQVFDFPPDVPILRFLDTRGLGESAYDPTEDLRFAENQAHLVLVTMRAMDLAQSLVIDVVAAVRRRHPHWPVVVAQTCLHEAYPPGVGHVLPYPFNSLDPDTVTGAVKSPDLVRCLRHQRTLMASIPGTAPVIYVPIDFTQVGDGMLPRLYGVDAFVDALIRTAPAAMRSALLALPIVGVDERARLADPIIMGHAMAAAGSDLVPVAGAVAASAVQARLLQRLGTIYDIAWDRRTLAELAAALGSGVAARTLVGMGARQLAKLIPVYGQTVAAATSAAMSFAVTYAIGKAAVHFLTQRRRGLETDGTAEAYQSALRHALRLAKARDFEPTDRRSGK